MAKVTFQDAQPYFMSFPQKEWERVVKILIKPGRGGGFMPAWKISA